VNADGSLTITLPLSNVDVLTLDSPEVTVSASGALQVCNLAPGSAHTITIANVSGGVQLTLDGQVFQYAPGQISSVTVNGGTSNDTVNVESSPAGVPVTLSLGGTDAINVCPTAQELTGLGGTVTVNGSTQDTLSVDSQGDSGLSYVLTATTLSFVPANPNAPGDTGLVAFSGIADAVLNTGTGNAVNDDTLIQGVAAGTALTVNSGPGYLITVGTAGGPLSINGQASDTLQGPNSNNQWLLSGAGSGTLDGSIDFSAIGNLVGGRGADTFRFQKGGQLSGRLDGGGGTNALDYSAYTGDVTVDLALNLASLVAGGVFHIQNVTGSIGNDLLVGDANANVLIGGTGRNVIIGGGGPDQIIGGGGDNLLIGGTTSCDTNLAALDAIFQVWDDPTLSFDQRVKELSKGIQVNGQFVVLNKTTVQADGATDSLEGGGELNWFFADAANLINDGNGPDPNDRFTRI
jgi:hypothetical protein